jgi:hypothetical protein
MGARKIFFRKIVVFLQRRESEILRPRKVKNALRPAANPAALKSLKM